MFPSNETISVKEFAFMLSSRIGKTGLPLKFSQAIRLLEKFGGYTVTNDNPNYKVREVSRLRALEIIEMINVAPKNGRRI